MMLQCIVSPLQEIAPYLSYIIAMFILHFTSRINQSSYTFLLEDGRQVT